jgi:hypothetical protein
VSCHRSGGEVVVRTLEKAAADGRRSEDGGRWVSMFRTTDE